MPSLFLLLVQAAGAASPPAAVPRCEDRAPGGEIVVCAPSANASSPYRIDPQPGRRAGLPKAALKLANGMRAVAETEQADVGGFPSDRLMVRLKIKF